MLTDRRQRLLRLLLTANGPLAATEIGRLLGYPARSVRYDLDILSDWVADYGAELISTAGVGYVLQGDRERLRAALDQLGPSSAVPYEYVLSPRERVHRLLIWLLGESEPLSHQELADRLGVSRSTVYNDLASVQTWLGRRGLVLQRLQNGIGLQGPEDLWRQAVADLIGELADEGQVAILLDDEAGKEPLGSLLDPLVPASYWCKVGQIVRSAGIPEMAVHVAVMVSRLAKGYPLPFRAHQMERAAESRFWPLAQSVCIQAGERFHLRFPPMEAAQLALLMQTVNLPATPFGSVALNDEEMALGRSLAMWIQTRLGVPLMQDDEFVVGLALHLRPARHRLERGQVVENPLLDEIKGKYPAVFQAAQDVARVLESQWHVTLPEPEVGYLAMHIAAAIERATLYAEQPPKALVVCGSGVGVAQLLATRLKASMPELRVGRVVSAFQMRRALREENHDLIITTCQIPPTPLPVVRVTPLLTEADQLKIRKAVEGMRSKAAAAHRPSLAEVLTPASIALDVEAADWKEAVRTAGDLLVQAGYAEPRYGEAMVRMAEELGPYVVFGPGFALPHAGIDDGVLRPGFALVRLKHSVPFGHASYDPVDLIFALCAVDYESHLKALMQLAELFGNPDSMAALRAAPDIPAVMALIHQVSALTPEGVD